MQMYNSLMRYHSAPSYVLAGLSDEEYSQPGGSDAFSQVEESEFARFLDDHLLGVVNPQSGLKPLLSADFLSVKTEEAEACPADSEILPQSHLEHKCSTSQQPRRMAIAGSSMSIKSVFRGPLSSISELCADGSNQTCSLDVQTDLLSTLIMERSDPIGESVLHFGSPSVQKLGKGGSSLSHGCATFPFPAGSISTIDQVNCIDNTEDRKGTFLEAKNENSLADERKSSLSRQNSSPAGLLSQISFGGLSSSLACTEPTSSTLSMTGCEEGRRGGGASQAARFWSEFGCEKAGFEHRKRGREAHHMHRLQSSEISFTNPNYPLVGSHVNMCRSNNVVKMEVLCRVSAKRGCATHPRSIAERVRRTKINEGIRKLQELMPSMEKQTNTVTMLDEAVEYVKFLQQQVQELSESRPKCDGRCKPKRSTAEVKFGSC